jgi:hypothetical protein
MRHWVRHALFWRRRPRFRSGTIRERLPCKEGLDAMRRRRRPKPTTASQRDRGTPPAVSQTTIASPTFMREFLSCTQDTQDDHRTGGIALFAFQGASPLQRLHDLDHTRNIATATETQELKLTRYRDCAYIRLHHQYILNLGACALGSRCETPVETPTNRSATSTSQFG